MKKDALKIIAGQILGAVGSQEWQYSTVGEAVEGELRNGVSELINQLGIDTELEILEISMEEVKEFVSRCVAGDEAYSLADDKGDYVDKKYK